MPYKINEKCTNCRDCVDLCPTKSVYFGSGRYVIDTDTCLENLVCKGVCKVDAIVFVPAPPPPKPPKQSNEQPKGAAKPK